MGEDSNIFKIECVIMFGCMCGESTFLSCFFVTIAPVTGHSGFHHLFGGANILSVGAVDAAHFIYDVVAMFCFYLVFQVGVY